MKKKEVIIIISIIVITILLAFLPNLIKSNTTNVSNSNIENTKNNTISIKIIGEIKEDEITIVVPKGASYGYIISKMEMYLNEYSLLDSNLKKRYYEDETITILSQDTSCYEEKEVSNEYIKLSTASKSELMSLYGIGNKRADKIIEYRESHEIDSWDTLRKLLGISDEVLESIKKKAVL